MLTSVNFKDKLSTFSEPWVPRIVGELNGQYVKVVKCKGEYVWHHHEHEDEMFFVLKGALDIELEDGTVSLKEGECCIIPRGVEHRPKAEAMAEVMLFEPATTRNTGNVDHEYTIEADRLKSI